MNDEVAGGMMLDAAYLRVDANCYSTTGKCLAAEEIERLRALVAEQTERLREMTKERDVAKAAIEALGKIAGGVSITNGDMTCTLAYWARETLRRMGT